MEESQDALELHLVARDKQQLCGSTNPHSFVLRIILPLIYVFASHWLVRAACMWLPWKDALRTACEASSSNHGAGFGSGR